MKKVPIKIPDGVDFNDLNTITPSKINKYYIDILNYFGHFCGDCKFLNESHKCNKGHRPRMYALELGNTNMAFLKKLC